MLLVTVDAERFLLTTGEYGDRLIRKVYFEFCFRVNFYCFEYFIKKLRTYLHRQYSDIERVMCKDACKEARYHAAEPVIIDSPSCVFAATTTAEVFTGNENL